MTPRERVQAVLNRHMPDRLPCELKLTPELLDSLRGATGSDDPAEHFQLEVRDVFIRPPSQNPDFSPYYPEGVPPLPNPAGWEVGEWGVGQEPGSQHHFIRLRHPMRNLTTLDELRGYPFPDYRPAERHAHLEAEVKAHHSRGLFAIGFMEWTVFEIAWHMRGMDNLFADMESDPALATYLLDRITDVRCFQARRYAQADVDLIKIGDDVGTQRGMMMNPALYRRWLKPRYAEVIKAARAVNPRLNICYHSDGDCRDIIPDLIEVGVTVLNPVQPECIDLGWVKREYGRHLVFWGGVGTQTTMPFGTPEEVFETVQRTIGILGPTGCFPCPTHVLEPEVPWANIHAFLRAVREYPC